jgi:ADP-heptose:LPS heptosyltransferase
MLHTSGDLSPAAFFNRNDAPTAVIKYPMPRTDPKDFPAATRDAKKILVVDLGFLGDTVHLVPALWEVKDHYPKAALHVLTTPVGREVLKMVRCVDKAWAFPLGPPSPKWWEHWDVLRALRRERFDAAINFSGSDRSVFVMRAIGARESLVYQGARKHFWQPWLIRRWIARAQMPTPLYEARRHVLELAGFQLRPARFDFIVPEADREWARVNIPEGAVHLSPSASFALKEWPLENNLGLIRELFAAKDFQRNLVVSAAPNPREQARLEQLRREITDPRLLVVTEKLSIPRLAAMLERCAMHVGPDSGVIHVANALNVPTVSIFRRYGDMADFLPVGPRHIYFDAPCPCMALKNPACAEKGSAACLAGIAPERVAAEILKRLAEPSLVAAK